MSRIGLAARKGATKRKPKPDAPPVRLTARDIAKRQRVAAKQAALASVCEILGLPHDPRRDLALARRGELHRDLLARIGRQRAAREAWTAAELAEQRAHLERRFGYFARLRDGSLAVVRRHLPPGAERVDLAAARALVDRSPLRVVGLHGTASPLLSRAEFARLAGPLLEAAA